MRCSLHVGYYLHWIPCVLVEIVTSRETLLQVASLDSSMGRFASRIMLQAHRQEILVVHPLPNLKTY